MNKENIECYNKMRQVFLDNVEPGDIYDVDMFCSDLCKSLFLETDPQDIGEDDYLAFREALILLVRDDMLLDWFGLAGLCIIYSEMSSNGEHYYVKKLCTKSDVPRFLEMLKQYNVPAEYCVGLFSCWCNYEGTACLAEKCMEIQSAYNIDMTAVWKWLSVNKASTDTDWPDEVDRYKEVINGRS